MRWPTGATSRPASSSPPPDFPALATAMGAHGVHVESAEELAAALAEAVERPGPTLIHLFEDSRAAADMLGP